MAMRASTHASMHALMQKVAMQVASKYASNIFASMHESMQCKEWPCIHCKILIPFEKKFRISISGKIYKSKCWTSK